MFDINGTLFRLSHECHHCFGDRKRILRASCAQFAWAEYIADCFSQQLFNKRFYQLESLECSSSPDSQAILKKLLKRIDEEKEVFRKQFSELLQGYINPMSTTAEPEMVEDETNYYEVNCIRLIHLSMGLNFLISRNNISPLYRDTLSLLLQHQIDLLRDISHEMAHDKKANHREILSELEYYLNHCEEISPHDMQDSFSGMLYRLFNGVTAPDQMLMEELLDDDPRSADNKEYNALLYTIGGFAKTALNVMSECFADCMSAKRLGMRLPDFLLAFVYETWDMDKAMPENLTNVLRMGVDLKILFGIDKLKRENWKSVRGLKDNYTNAGFELKVDLEQYYNRLNSILIKYQSLSAVGDKIICYLEECGISSADSNQQNFKDLYGQDLYKKCRDPRKSKERIYYFLDYWKKLAEKEEKQTTGA